MALITNWGKGAAMAAHDADMERAEMAIRAAQARQSAQAQRFNQQRTMAQDAEARANSERAYRDQREDLAYNRKQAERAYNDQRADLAYNRQRNAEQEAYNRGRQERVDALALDRERRLNEASQFDRMLKEEEAAHRRELWERDNAEYEKIQQEEQERKLQMESSFASLLSAGFKYGDEVKPGVYCIPTPYIQKFNERTGQQLGGLVIATRDTSGNPLKTPQLMAYEPMFDNQGKQVLGVDGKTPQMQLTPMPEAFVKGMFAAYDGVLRDASGRFPAETETWVQTMFPTEAKGNKGSLPVGAKEYLSSLDKEIETLNDQIKAEQGRMQQNPDEVVRLKTRIDEVEEEKRRFFSGLGYGTAPAGGGDGVAEERQVKFPW